VLTRDFKVPPENLTTQGYGEQYLKVNTQSASRFSDEPVSASSENASLLLLGRLTLLLDQRGDAPHGAGEPPGHRAAHHPADPAAGSAGPAAAMKHFPTKRNPGEGRPASLVCGCRR
jgi:hypothetical protein